MDYVAVIFCNPGCALLRLAGLSTLERSMVAAHRAGAGEIVVVGAAQDVQLRRATALGIQPRFHAVLPAAMATASHPVLVMSDAVVVQTADLKRLARAPGRLANAAGHPLAVGLISPGQPIELASLDQLPSVTALGVAVSVVDAESARNAEALLWRSLTSASDGTVDRWFNRPVGRPLSKVLILTAVTPNQVSVAATLLGVLSGWVFAQGSPLSAMLAALTLQASAILDCIDGDIARMVFKESELGKWLDLVGDQIVHIAVFTGIGLGLSRGGSEAPVVALAVSAGCGVAIAFAVVLRGMLNPRLVGSSAFQKLVDATTNRDFSVVLIVLAWIGKLEWFLWLAGIGVHLFWGVALVLQGNAGKSQAAGSKPGED